VRLCGSIGRTPDGGHRNDEPDKRRDGHDLPQGRQSDENCKRGDPGDSRLLAQFGNCRSYARLRLPNRSRPASGRLAPQAMGLVPVRKLLGGGFEWVFPAANRGGRPASCFHAPDFNQRSDDRAAHQRVFASSDDSDSARGAADGRRVTVCFAVHACDSRAGCRGAALFGRWASTDVRRGPGEIWSQTFTARSTALPLRALPGPD
jgi:hypothetical protein